MTSQESLLLAADRFRFFSHAFRYPEPDTLEALLGEMVEVWPEARELLHRLTRDRDRLQELYMPLMKGEIPLSRVSYTLQVAADLQGLYRVFGVQPRGGENPDALPVVLEFAAFMKTKIALAPDEERRHIATEGYRKLIEDLVRWVPLFSKKVRETLPDTFHAVCAEMLEAFLREEARALPPKGDGPEVSA